jgi:hypothetical protein
MINTLKALRSGEFYGAGKYTEIAKGKYEYTLNWRDIKRKIRRIWLSRKR